MSTENTNVYLIGVPSEQQENVRTTVEDALSRFRDEVEYHEEIGVVVLEAQPMFVIPQEGLCGRAVGKTGLEVFIDFGRSFTEGELEYGIANTVYHEAGHLAREHWRGLGHTLLDYMISEGVSSYLETHFQSDRFPPYAKPIEGEERYLKEAEPVFNEEEFDYGKWFFGRDDFPQWVGYRLGFLIVQEYMKHNQVSIAELIKKESQEIWEKSTLLSKN